MKILLDECVTKRLKAHLISHDVSTVKDQGWAGLKNGALMAIATESGLDILLTIDKNIQRQQTMAKYNLIVVILDTPSSKSEMLIKFLPAFEEQVSSFSKGKLYIINL